ncbi:MAG: RNA polymerase sigma factor [Paludibacteraceae bacterium]
MDRIVKTYQQPLYRYLRRMLHNSEDAKDVLQNTWIQLFTHLGELREQPSERAYVYRVATNCAFMWLRDEKVCESLDDVDAQTLQTLKAEPQVEMGQELLARLEQTVLRLPPTQRAVFNLRYHEDMSYDEIAAITGSTIGAAKMNYSLAKRKISYWITAAAVTVALVITLSIGVVRPSSSLTSDAIEVVYASEEWSDFAEDDVFLEL